MKETSVKDVQKSIAKRLARHDVRDDVVAKVAQRVAKNGLKVGYVDFCPYGICVDYFSENRFSIDEFVADDRYRAVKLFPYGILVDDLFQIRVEMQVPELDDFRM